MGPSISLLLGKWKGFGIMKTKFHTSRHVSNPGHTAALLPNGINDSAKCISPPNAINAEDEEEEEECLSFFSKSNVFAISIMGYSYVASLLLIHLILFIY